MGKGLSVGYSEGLSLVDPIGKTVLDYGCGQGHYALDFAARGAKHVTGIDLSEIAVSRGREKAMEMGIADRVDFLVADAHKTGLQTASFDLIFGTAILHHLNLEVALKEIRRLLKPSGKAIFIEPLAHNPLLRIGRFLTPGIRTPDEHPLTREDWETCAAVFAGFRHYEYEFIAIPFMLVNWLIPSPFKHRVARAVNNFDRLLFDRYPSLRGYARITVLVLE